MPKMLALTLVAAVASATSIATMANSRSVDLRSPDGAVDVQGTLIEFADGNYRIDTPLGEFKVSANRVDCVGSGCPFFDTNEPDIRIVVSEDWESELILRLTDAFAKHIGAHFELFDLPRKGERFFQVSRRNGTLIRFAMLETTEGGKAAALKSGYADAGITPVTLQVPGLTSTVLATEAMVPVRHPTSLLGENATQQLTEALAIETQRHPLKELAKASTPELSMVQPELSSIVLVSQDEADVRLVPARHVQNGLAGSLLDSCGAPMRSDRFAIKTGNYPFVRKIYLQHRRELSGTNAGEFLSFMSSRNATLVLEDEGLFDQWIEVLPMNAQASTLRTDTQFGATHKAELYRVLHDLRETKQRLSSTFYFPTGSVDTDHIEPLELKRLVTYLAGLPDRTNIVFSGFTDDVGGSTSNTKLSHQRASQLVERIKDLGGDALSKLSISAAGFGEIAPVTCNSNELGRSLNRRVEVWLDNSNSKDSQ